MATADLSLVDQLDLPTEFPTTFFPRDLETYRQDLISNTSIPGDFAAAGMLAAISVGIGNSVVGRFGTRRFVPASLYLLMVGNPGNGKSPAVSMTLEAVRREQTARVQAAMQPTEAFRQHQVADVTGGELTCEPIYNMDEDGAEFGGDSVAPSTGDPLSVRHLYLTDATIAGVREALLNNPRGIVVSADEAVSLFKGAGKGNDRPIWLELWNAESLAVSRRSGKPPIITIPRCFVTMITGTQPDIFPQLRNTHGDDGLLDRILIFGDGSDDWPTYSHCETDAALAATYNGTIDRLLQHRDSGSTLLGGSAAVLQISNACSRVFEACHHDITAVFDRVHAARRFGGLITKLVANAARLAVLRACSRWAADGPTTVASPTDVLEEDAIEACNVVRFNLGRALLWRPELVNSAAPRVAATTTGSAKGAPANSKAAAQPMLHRQILDYLARRGLDEVEVRRLRSSGCFGAASSYQLRAACDALVAAGFGQWRDARKSLLVLWDYADAATSGPNTKCEKDF